MKTAQNIEFLWDSVITDFITDQKVTGAKIQNLKTGEVKDFLCDGVFVSIGRKPATDFLGNAVALNNNGYIIADESTKTDVQGVYAVGDVRTKALRQVVTAVADGAVAVHYAEEYLTKI